METYICFYYRNFINELFNKRVSAEFIISQQVIILMT